MVQSRPAGQPLMLTMVKWCVCWDKTDALCRCYASILNPSVVFIERFERVVAGLNLTAEEKNNAIALLIDYLHGFALAMNCNRDREALHTGMIAGALELYCRALEKSA